MEKVKTTPFEDLILGSQFFPVLASSSTISKDNNCEKRVGVLQCRQCKATFLQEQEALIHYKLHVFETHKSHFSVVVGGLCPRGACSFAGGGRDAIHFHCAHCPFAAREILDLPLHMERAHLSIYKEVSLVLRGESVQVNKVLKCGECDKSIQGTVSTALHFLLHEPDQMSKMEEMVLQKLEDIATNTLVNGCGVSDETSLNHNSTNDSDGEKSVSSKIDASTIKQENDSSTKNGQTLNENSSLADINNGINSNLEEKPATDEKEIYDVPSKEKEAETNGDVKNVSEAMPVKLEEVNIPEQNGIETFLPPLLIMDTEHNPKTLLTNPQLSNLQGRVLIPLLLNSMRERNGTEVSPLALLASLMEADQKSDWPMIPTQHFLLDASPEAMKEEDQGYMSPPSPSADGDPSPESLLNGFRDTYMDNYVDQPAGVFQCDRCPEAFKYQYLLAAHRKQAHLPVQRSSPASTSFPFRCHVCGNEFTVLPDLKVHVETHSVEYTSFCELCGYAFTNQAQLDEHVINHSKVTSGKEYSSRGSHSVERSNRCECCAVKFPSKAELTHHIVKYQGTCNPNKTEGIKCATCGAVMLSLEALKTHRLTEHPTAKAASGKRGFECDYCGKTFSCRSNLRDHLVVHTGEKPYPCDICGKTFSFVHNMKTHRLTHNEGRNEMCPYCDRAYKSKISLYYHMKKGNCRGLSTKEVPEGFHRCTECLQMFASEERYLQHKSKGHCQTSYRCEHCGARCSTQEKLARHLDKGGCTKTSGGIKKEVSSATPSRRSRRDNRGRSKRRSEPSEENICERCNYGHDCCCTFGCNYCGKRIFSFDAYNAHRKRLCPARRSKEKLRAAIEKRRQQKCSAEMEISEGTANDSEITLKKSNALPPPTNATALNPPIEGGEAMAVTPEEDSNSGSLTDLSPFTTSHLLGSVSSVQET